MFIILSYLGCCTDLVASVIDNRGVNIHAEGYYLWMDESRNVLKREIAKTEDPEIVANQIASSQYKVLETYVHKFKIEPNSNNHTYLSIDSSSKEATEWVINRMNTIYPDHNLNPTSIKNASIINGYYSNWIITLEEILEGKLIERLKEITDQPLDERLYRTYLSILLEDFPFPVKA